MIRINQIWGIYTPPETKLSMVMNCNIFFNREGDQILKITIIDKNDEKTKVFTKDIVGIGSHREVIETLENVNSQLHLLSLVCVL